MSVQHSEPGNYFTPAEGNKDFLPRESPLDSRRLSTQHYSLITAHRGKTLQLRLLTAAFALMLSATVVCFLNEIFTLFISPAEQEVNGLFLSCL